MHVAGRVGVEPAPVALDRLADRLRVCGEHEGVEVANVARERELRLHRRPVARVERAGFFDDPPQPATTPAAAAPASSSLRVRPPIRRLYAAGSVQVRVRVCPRCPPRLGAVTCCSSATTSCERIDGGLARCRAGAGRAWWVEARGGHRARAALAAAAARAQAASGVRVLSARGGELEREFAFGIVRQLFEPALAEAPERRASAARRAARAWPCAWPAGELAERRPSRPVRRAARPVLAGGEPRSLVARLSSSSTTPTGPTCRRCASSPSSSRGSTSCRSRSSWSRGRPVEPGRRGSADRAAHERAPTSLRAASRSHRRRRPASSRTGWPAAEEAFAAACREATRGNPLLVRALVGGAARTGVTPVAAEAGRVEQVGTPRWPLDPTPGPAPRAGAARLDRPSRFSSGPSCPTRRACRPRRRRRRRWRPTVLIAPACCERPAAGVRSPDRAHERILDELAARRPGRPTEAARMLATRGASEARVAEHLLAADRAAIRGWSSGSRPRRAGPRPAARPSRPRRYLRRALAEPPPPRHAAGCCSSSGPPSWRRAIAAGPSARGAVRGRGRRRGAARRRARARHALVFHGSSATPRPVTDRVAGRARDRRRAARARGDGRRGRDARRRAARPRRARSRAAAAAARAVGSPQVVAVAAYCPRWPTSRRRRAALARRAVPPGPPGAAPEPPWFLTRRSRCSGASSAEAPRAGRGGGGGARRRATPGAARRDPRPARLARACRRATSRPPRRTRAPVLDAPGAAPLYRELATARASRGRWSSGRAATRPRTRSAAPATPARPRPPGSCATRAAACASRSTGRRRHSRTSGRRATSRCARSAPSPGYLPWRSAAALARLALGDRDAARDRRGRRSRWRGPSARRGRSASPCAPPA